MAKFSQRQLQSKGIRGKLTRGSTRKVLLKKAGGKPRLSDKTKHQQFDERQRKLQKTAGAASKARSQEARYG